MYFPAQNLFEDCRFKNTVFKTAMRGKLLFSPHPLAPLKLIAGALPPHPHQRAQCALWKPKYRALRRGRIAETLFSAQYNFYFTLYTALYAKRSMRSMSTVNRGSGAKPPRQGAGRSGAPNFPPFPSGKGAGG